MFPSNIEFEPLQEKNLIAIPRKKTENDPLVVKRKETRQIKACIDVVFKSVAKEFKELNKTSKNEDISRKFILFFISTN